MNKIQEATANLIHKMEDNNEVYTPVGLLKLDIFDFLYKRGMFVEAGWDGQVFKFKDFEAFKKTVSFYDTFYTTYFTRENEEFFKPPRFSDIVASSKNGKRTYYKRRFVASSEAKQGAYTPEMVSLVSEGKKLRKKAAKLALENKELNATDAERLKICGEKYKKLEKDLLENVNKFLNLQKKIINQNTAYIRQHKKEEKQDVSFVIFP